MTSPRALSLTMHIERWPIAGSFAISRGAKTEAVVVVVELSDGRHRGRGECVPYARYGESPQGVIVAVENIREKIAAGLGREALQQALPPGAARNGLDCAFWDFEAKSTGMRAYELAQLAPPQPLVTAFTISLAAPEAMARAAQAASDRPLLKIKLGGEGDVARIQAVRRAAAKAELIADANEGWNADNLAENLAACADAGVTLVEQPLPADADDVLASIARPVTVCADESVHDCASLAALSGKYDAVNIKLDKTGGLTEALKLAAQAEARGFSIMAGCMVSTSLAMAPAMLLAQKARLVDLDGPLLLQKDRQPGLVYDGSIIQPPPPELWG
jgi:L-Ala-D/L-Glu epimerase / N-acetyl-D-glutamate racemase